TDWFGCALSAGLVATTRRTPSFSLGLWHSTHCSIWLRFSPWSDRLLWQPLHLAMSTTLLFLFNDAATTEKLKTLFMAPYSVTTCWVVPPNRVISRRPSAP